MGVNRNDRTVSPRLEDMDREQQIAVSQAAKLVADEFGIDDFVALRWIVNAIDFRGATKAKYGCDRCGIVAFSSLSDWKKHHTNTHVANAKNRKKIAKALMDAVTVDVVRGDDDARDRSVQGIPTGFPVGRATLLPVKVPGVK